MQEQSKQTLPFTVSMIVSCDIKHVHGKWTFEFKQGWISYCVSREKM